MSFFVKNLINLEVKPSSSFSCSPKDSFGAEKKQNAAAAPDAFKGSEKAWLVEAASVKAEEKGERRCSDEAK